ncbi:ABC transporter permease [Pseudidiomarina homiensis]|uniref:ABC transporter permease n=1 Tax=Pseudidiomarina homiensis TaxID=364198 RepID=A0A432Y356_9GAMM|nr:ABC transporter permease [Pseudidiomarina homiensis]RUO55400.1 ABC transporter permease [Pseudidiomarina homiensis]
MVSPHVTLLAKLLREVWHARAQLFAIAIVVSVGVMVLLIMTTARQSLVNAQQTFYDEHRFADVFVELTRAPQSLLTTVQELPGVAMAETRIRSAARIELDGFADPIQAQLVSLPEQQTQLLNTLHLRSGALPTNSRQVVVSEPFAQAHQLQLYDAITAILNGRRTELEIVGIAISPEFIYQIGPADIMPDYQRYGVFWLREDALAAALDMDGAFNSLLVKLEAQANRAHHTDKGTLQLRLDQLFERYGGRGSYTREEQISHRFLSEELKQLRTNSIFLPIVFLGTSAFLFNIFMQRQIHTQQQIIAIMKAFGYRPMVIFLHYLGYSSLVVLLGLVLGVILSRWLAATMVELYGTYFSFIELGVKLNWRSFAIAVVVTFAAGFIGTWRAIYQAVQVPPAQAMRPPSPANFQQSRINHFIAVMGFGQTWRIILRNLVRHPLRSTLSVLGIALAGGLLLFGSYQFQAISTMLDRNYRVEQQMDVIVHFTQVTDAHGLTSLAALSGVNYVEGMRSVPVRLHNGRQLYSTSITAFDSASQLRQLASVRSMPTTGLILTDHLADYLQLETGSNVTVEFIGERRLTRSVPLVATTNESIGVGAYMALGELNHILLESSVLSGAWLLIDDSHKEALYAELNKMPQVAGYSHIREAETKLRSYMDDTVLTAMSIIFVLAGSLTFAMVYNNARIALAERERELATLRVLGYSYGEVARLLFGELLLLVLIAIPLGWLCGFIFAAGMTELMSSELFRIPFVISRQLFGLSAFGVLTAALIAVIFMLRRLKHIDLVAALKSE